MSKRPVDADRDGGANDDPDHIQIGLTLWIQPGHDHLADESSGHNGPQQFDRGSRGMTGAHVRIGQVPSAPGTGCHVMDSWGRVSILHGPQRWADRAVRAGHGFRL